MTRTEVLHDLDIDLHEDLFTKFGLSDRTRFPDFVRVEMVPVDGDVFNQARKNWRLTVDQDYRPEWFSEKEASEAVWDVVQATFKARFLTTGQVLGEVNNGRWYMNGSAIVKRLCDTAVIQEMRGTAMVGSVRDVSAVELVCGSARVGLACDSATLKRVCGSARVKLVHDSATVKELCDSAAVEHVGGSATVERVCGRAVVERLSGSATVERVCDSAAVKRVCGSATAIIYSRHASWEVHEKAVVICRYGSPMSIVVAEKGAKFEIRG
ncbi:MAG: hypothetical protein WC728_08015 [Elusimicrobiota bacterium]